jgi:hypothetical protein
MDKKILFEKAEILIGKLAQYHKSSTIKFKDSNEVNSVKEVYNAIHGTTGLNLCLDCIGDVLHALNIINSWYEREHPKYLSAQEPAEQVTEAPEIPLVEQPPTKPAKKRPSRKKPS